MGGRSSSDASTNTQTLNQDRRIVADAGGIGVNADNSSVSIVATDHGAVDGAVDLGKTALAMSIGTVGSTAETFAKEGTKQSSRALDSVDDAMRIAINFAESQAQRADKTVRGAGDLVQSAFTTANDIQQGNRTLAIAGLIIAGIVGAGVFMKKG